MLSSIHREEYQVFVQNLAKVREKKGLTQVVIAARISKTQSHVQKTLTAGRRMDCVESFQWMKALEMTPDEWMKLVELSVKQSGRKG